jgi:hypothetical protein
MGNLAVGLIMNTKYLDEYLKELTALQKRFFDSWLENVPNAKEGLDLSENLEKALKVQEDLVETYLETQRKTTEVLLNTQKQFWDDYFEVIRKVPTPVAA